MAHQRTRSSATATSIGGLSHPHALSLKVLRLSRPSLATQSPLPAGTTLGRSSGGSGLEIPPTASRAYPPASNADAALEPLAAAMFPLTPLLTLPPAFGAAYVGEPFACTLCANNELLPGDGRRVRGVRITAELLLPGAAAGDAVPVELTGEEAEEGEPTVRRGQQGADADGDGVELVAGDTLQRTLRHELTDEGPHQLAVTVSYVEIADEGSAGETGEGRARTFRKLYQFAAQPLIAVRSKVTERKRRDARREGRQWVLEAQLENVGETSAVLERVWLTEREGVGSTGLNRDSDEGAAAVVLKPQDVEQVMFVLTERPRPEGEGGKDPGLEPGAAALAQVNVEWRTAMGEKGRLTTGWLASRGR